MRRLCPRRARVSRSRPRCAARRARGHPRGPRRRRTTPCPSRRWCAPPWRSATPALAERLVPVSSPATPTPSTPSSRRTPPSPRPAGTYRPPPMPTPMPPIAGSGSGSSPSRRSRSSARAGVSSDSPDRPRPHPSCSTPARSSSGSSGPRARRDRRAPRRRGLTIGGRRLALSGCSVAEDRAPMLPKPLPGHRPRKGSHLLHALERKMSSRRLAICGTGPEIFVLEVIAAWPRYVAAQRHSSTG